MSLVDLVEAGDAAGAETVWLRLTAEQRRAELPGLKRLRQRLRGNWERRSGPWPTLMVVGAVCHSAPAAAATWLAAGDFEGVSGWTLPPLLRLLEAQPAEWQAAVAARLAERRGDRWGGDERFRITELLVRRSGCPVPTDDAFVVRWARDRSLPQSDHPGGARRTGCELYERLAADPFTPVLAPQLFEAPGITNELDGPWGAPEHRRWPAALARLAEDGVLDRAELIDRCLARLLRGGRPAELRSFLTALKAFAPTTAENAAHVRTHLALLDSQSTVAGHAQQQLIELDAAGLLPEDLIEEASRTVLFRAEKKLVRSQLGWLDRTARRDRAAAARAVLAAAGAYGHPDRGIQELALNLTARHLRAAGEGVLPELRAEAALLDPAHRARAAEMLGPVGPADGTAGSEEAEAYRELLPPVPVPQALPGPVGSPAEAAEEVAAVLAGDRSVAAFERALDGLVRFAHRDRAALAEALEPVLRTSGHWIDLWNVADAVREDYPPYRALEIHRGVDNRFRTASTTSFDAQTAARMEEAIWRIVVRPALGLLALPTRASGAIDPAELVDRLRRYEEAGIAPGPVDLGAALLRVAPTEDPEVLAAADRLESPEGERLARWLRTGGLPRQQSSPLPRAADGWRSIRRLATQPGTTLADPLPADTAVLVGPTGKLRMRGIYYSVPAATPHWLAVLPQHREELAARLLSRFADAADASDHGERGAPQLLPQLAEADGPVGLAVHLALAYGLAARDREDRTAAVDALLVLAARGDLDAGLLGRETAELFRINSVKPNRLVDALRSAADTGAYRTVWSVLAAVLPEVLPGTAAGPETAAVVPVRAAADLVALAGDCVRRCGRGTAAVPDGLAELAGRSGSTRLVKEARALHALLTG